MNDYSCIAPDALETALACCKGSYQRNLIAGVEALSGATLRGKAKSYSRHYKASAENLMYRMRRAGLYVGEVRGAKGKRILFVCASPVGGLDCTEKTQ